jgi:integrase
MTFKLFEVFEQECLKYKVIIYLALDTGAIRGKLTGLEWGDIDFKTIQFI